MAPEGASRTESRTRTSLRRNSDAGGRVSYGIPSEALVRGCGLEVGPRGGPGLEVRMYSRDDVELALYALEEGMGAGGRPSSWAAA